MACYDVLVAGAGPAGSVVATLLARTGRRVCLVDRFADQGHKIGECLPGPAVQLLRRLGLPEPDEAGPHERISGVVSCWGAEVAQRDAFNEPSGGDWRLDRRGFDRDLQSVAVAQGVYMVRDFIRDVSYCRSGWCVQTTAGNSFQVPLLIDASGRRARIARRIGARQQADDPVVAVWAVGKKRRGGHGTQTLIEQIADGWWYGAFLPSGEPVAVFHCSPEIASHLTRNPEQWLALLADTQLLADRLPVDGFQRVSLKCADARGLVLDTACGTGWYACGDAAISFNPLSSQGLFNALATAAMVAKAIREHDTDIAAEYYQAHIDRVRETYSSHMKELDRRSTFASEAASTPCE